MDEKKLENLAYNADWGSGSGIQKLQEPLWVIIFATATVSGECIKCVAPSCRQGATDDIKIMGE